MAQQEGSRSSVYQRERLWIAKSLLNWWPMPAMTARATDIRLIRVDEVSQPGGLDGDRRRVSPDVQVRAIARSVEDRLEN